MAPLTVWADFPSWFDLDQPNKWKLRVPRRRFSAPPETRSHWNHDKWNDPYSIYPPLVKKTSEGPGDQRGFDWRIRFRLLMFSVFVEFRSLCDIPCGSARPGPLYPKGNQIPTELYPRNRKIKTYAASASSCHRCHGWPSGDKGSVRGRECVVRELVTAAATAVASRLLPYFYYMNCFWSAWLRTRFSTPPQSQSAKTSLWSLQLCTDEPGVGWPGWTNDKLRESSQLLLSVGPFFATFFLRLPLTLKRTQDEAAGLWLGDSGLLPSRTRPWVARAEALLPTGYFFNHSPLSFYRAGPLQNWVRGTTY